MTRTPGPPGLSCVAELARLGPTGASHARSATLLDGGIRYCSLKGTVLCCVQVVGLAPGTTEGAWMNEVMTLEEVADYLRVHYTTVRRWRREGELPALKVGRTYRVRTADLDVWWRERTQRHGRGGDEPASGQE